MIQNVGEIAGFGAKKRLYRFQNRFFAEVITDESGHVGVDGFVVGNPITYGIGKSHIAGAVGCHKSGDTKYRVFPEG